MSAITGKEVERPARTTDPLTSKEGPLQTSDVSNLQAKIMDILKEPQTDEQIADKLVGYHNPSSVRTRRKELERKGLVEDSGRTQKTRSGREAIVWQLKP